MNKKEKLQKCSKTHWEQMKDCYNLNSEYFSEMMKIISTSDKNKNPHHAHHIIPRSYFKKFNWEVDSSKENIAYLTPYEHSYVHYYAWKCATPLMNRSLATAWHYIVNGFTKNEKNLDVIAKDYSIATSHMKYTCDDVNRRLKKLESSFICIKEEGDEFLIKCKRCGEIKRIGHNWHSKEAVCKNCSYSDKRPIKGNYPLIMIIAWNKKAYIITGDEMPPNSKGNIHSEKTLKIRCDRLMKQYMKTGYVLKYKLIGVSNEKRNLIDIVPRKPTYSESLADSFSTLYELSPKIAKRYFPNITVGGINTTLKGFNKKELSKGEELYFKKFYIKEYFLEDAKTINEWGEILGMSWFKINKMYTVIEEKPLELFEYLLNECNKYSVSEVISGLKDCLEFLENVEKGS